MRIILSRLVLGFIAWQANPQALTIGKPVTFVGMCDASAAIFDSGQVLVLDDEDLDPPFLRYYDPVRGGPPAKTVTLSVEELALDSKKPELDLEAAALIGSRLYMAGSHGRNQNGKVRTSRQRLFAIDWPVIGSAVSVSGGPYVSLLPDLQAHLKKQTAKTLRKLVLDAELPPKEGGVNIEGLAATPRGHLLLGFRSPLVSGKALVIELKQPDKVLAGAKAEFGSPVLLDLGGHGVRDMVRDEVGESYVILSGPVGPGDSFGLYRWTGRSDDPPVLRRRSSSARLGLGQNVSAEALAFGPHRESLWMFFDEGNRPVVDQPCKTSGRKSFRGVQVFGF